LSFTAAAGAQGRNAQYSKRNEQMSFPNILKNAPKFLSCPDSLKTQEGLTEFICRDCDFYKEGEDEEIACGAFYLIQLLLEKKVVTVENIIDAIRSDVSDA
jgi:hypothetical protein